MTLDEMIEAAKSAGTGLVNQTNQDVSTMNQPRAVTDVANRGLVAGTVGAPVDLINAGLGGVDAASRMLPKEFHLHLHSDKPVGGSENIQDLMERFNMVTPTRRPVLESAAGLAPMLADPLLAAGKAMAPYAAEKIMQVGENTGMLPSLYAVPKGKKITTTTVEATPRALTPEEQKMLDTFGSKADREAALKKRVEQDKADELAGKSAGKSVRARGPVGAVEPDIYRKMQDEQGTDAVMKAVTAGKHLRPDGAGGYIGAPRTITSPQGLTASRRALDTDFANSVNAVKVADPTRMGTWYDRAKMGIAESSEPHQLDPVLDQHAVYSAGVSPESELGFALKHLTSRAVGDPVMAYRGAPMRALDQAQAEGKNVDLAFKTGEYRNKNDPRVPNTGLFGVNDFRRAQGMGYTDPEGNIWKGGVTDTMHPFMDAETALQVERANKAGVGGRTDWQGPHIQELPWVLGKAQDFYTRGSTGTGRYVGEPVDMIKKALADANNTARDYFYKHALSSTHEQVPGASTGHRSDILGGSEAEKKAYSEAAPWESQTPYTLSNAPTVGAGPRDPLYSALGFRQIPMRQGTGAYMNSLGQMENNPLSLSRPLVDFPTGGEGGISPSTLKAVELAENLRGIIDAQEASAAHLVNTMGGASGKNSVVLDTRHRNPDKLLDPSAGVMPTKNELNSVLDLLDKHGLSSDFGATATNRGITIFPYDAEGVDTRKLNKFLKVAGKDIQNVYPSIPQKGVFSGVYTPGIGKWGEKGIEPTLPYTGEATMNFLEKAAGAPHQLSMNLGESEGVRNAVKKKIERDVGAPTTRGDIQETRRFFAEADWPKAVQMIRDGMAPTAALAALGYSASSMAKEKK